jgi:hypothetical protein
VRKPLIDPFRARKQIMTVNIAEEPWDSADGVRLRGAMQIELAARYNMPDQEMESPTAESLSVFLTARDSGGDATGCGALRLLADAPDPADADGAAEPRRRGAMTPARGSSQLWKVPCGNEAPAEII